MSKNDTAPLEAKNMLKKENGKANTSMGFWRKAWKMGNDDPRKVIHAIKVGAALSVVCPLYLTEPIFKGFAGSNAIWAVITVVVVFEFSAGATLCKGLNRGLGTLAAGLLGLLVGFIGKHVPFIGQAIIIGAATFLFGAAVTYFRFIPAIKSRFDYAMVIFLLTFIMIIMSSYRVDNVLEMAYQRLVTIVIGCFICFLISWLIYPIWAGEDIHQHLVVNLQTMATIFKDCVEKYFDDSEMNFPEEEDSEDDDEDAIYKGYRTILDSKAAEESLASFARWEPRHGKFRFRYPWQRYLKVFVTIRHCTFTVVALHGCLSSEIQTPKSTRSRFRKQCMMVSAAAMHLLEELADSVEKMRRCRALEPMLKQVDMSVRVLQCALGSQPSLFVDSKRYTIREIPNATIHVPEEEEEEEKEHPNCKPEEPQEHIINDEITFPNYTSSLSMTKVDVKNKKSNLGFKEKLCSRMETWHGRERSYSLLARNNGNKYDDVSKDLEKGKGEDDNVVKRSFGESDVQFADAFPLATFASLMVEFTARLRTLAFQVEQLGKRARFRELTVEEERQGHGIPGMISKNWTASPRNLANDHGIEQSSAFAD